MMASLPTLDTIEENKTLIVESDQPLENKGANTTINHKDSENQPPLLNQPSASNPINQVDKKVAYGTFAKDEELQEQGKETLANDLPSGSAIEERKEINTEGEADKKEQVEENAFNYYFNLVFQFVQVNLGQTWFNLVIITSAVFFAWIVTKLRIGLVGAISVGYLLNKLFEASIKLTYDRKLEKIQATVAKPMLETDIEAAGWLNGILARFWYQFEPNLSKQITENVESVLATTLPAFLEGSKFSKFTLGSKPPIVEGIKYYHSDRTDVIIMDWMVSFSPNPSYNPNTNFNQTETQEDVLVQVDRIDSEIQFIAKVKLGPLNLEIPIVSSEFRFYGKVRVKLEFMNNFPHIKKAYVSLLEHPELDFSLKPIAPLGLDITRIPGFKTLLNRQVYLTLEPMMLAPSIYTVDIEGMMGASGETQSAIGVLKLTVVSAMGLKNVELLGVIDPFISINIEGRNELAQTKCVKNTTSPVWDETFTLLIYNLNETLNMIIKDQNDVKKDAVLGVTTFNLASLIEEPIQDNCDKVIRNNKERGNLTFKASYYPVAEAMKLEDGTEQAIISDTGILRLIIHEIQGLEPQRRLLPVGGKSKVWVDVKLNGFVRHSTQQYNMAKSIVVESMCEKFIDNLASFNIGFELKSNHSSQPIGRLNLSLQAFLEQLKNESWFVFPPTDNEENNKIPVKIKLSGRWSPVLMDSSHGTLPPAIGFVRVNIMRGKEIKYDSTTKVNPFVTLLMSNKVWGRTEIHDSSPNPIWDETFYVPIHQLKETLILEMKGNTNLGHSKKVGRVEIHLKDLVGIPVKDRKGFNDGELVEGWYPIKANQKTNGSLQISVQYFTLEQEYLPLKVDSTMRGSTIKQSEIDHKRSMSSLSSTTTPNNRSTTLLSANEVTEEPNKEGSIKETPPKVEQKLPVNYNQYPSGIIRVCVHEASNVTNIKTKLYALVTLNGNFRSPVLTTLVTRSYAFPKWEETGEGFVKETGVDQLLVEIKSSKDDKDKVLGSFNCKVKDILEQLTMKELTKQKEMEMGEGSKDRENYKDEGAWYDLEGSGGKVRISFEFTPCNYIIDESESARNMGILQVKVIQADNLISADKDGSSDPYITLSLNGNKKLKTKTKKNNLNPKYDEIFNLEVTDRINSVIRFEAFDWNQIQSHTSLGHFDLKLKHVETEIRNEATFELEGVDHGTVTLELFFAPYYVLRDVNPSLISAALSGNPVDLVGGLAKGGFMVATGTLNLGKDVLGGAAHLGIGTGKMALHGAKHVLQAPLKIGSKGKNLAKNLIGHLRGDDASRASDEHSDHSPPTLSVTEVDSNQEQPGTISKLMSVFNTSSHSLSSAISESNVTSRPSSRGGHYGDLYTIKLTIIEAKDLVAADRNGYSDPYVKVMRNKKGLYKTKVQKKTRNPYWEETCLLKDIPQQSDYELQLVVKDYNFLKENVELGTYSLFPWHHFEDVIDMNSPTTVQLWTPPGALKNGGVGALHLKMELILPHNLNPSNNTSPKNLQPVEENISYNENELDTDGDGEMEGRVKSRLKRNSIASIKPKSLLGSIKAKINKG